MSIYGLNDLNCLSNKNIFVDANILIFNFMPFNGDKLTERVKNYTKAFSLLLTSNNNFFINVLVISEFINRFIKQGFEMYISENQLSKSYSFKHEYRKTDHFYESLEMVSSIVKNKILKYMTIAEVDYNNDVLAELSLDLVKYKIDFNDLNFIKLCRDKNFILFTDDIDYQNMPIDILSGNKGYLR